MRGETMKDKSKKSTYSTTFGVDPSGARFEQKSSCKQSKKRRINQIPFHIYLFGFE